MKKVKMLTMIFTFWILIIILSASWLAFILTNNIHLIYTEITFLFVLIIASLSFFLSFFFIYQIIKDIGKEIKKSKEKERNIRDVYQYDQLLNPPSMYN